MIELDRLGAVWWESMLDGEFERAWLASDRIREIGCDDSQRLWQGEDITGKRVMLRCLHGFGDSVQFLRFVPLLRQRAASVCVEVAPRFRELAQCFDGVEHVITWGDAAPAVAPRWDVQMEVTELAYALRTQLEDLPLATRYLNVQPSDDPSAVPQRTSLLRVGLVWCAGDWNPQRSMAYDSLRPVLEVAGCEFWNLTTLQTRSMMREDVRSRNSLVGLAERIAALDLVITVDTLAAHIAGALGVPAWVMLLQACDWRWMRTREDSPWYPSLRLFRQGPERRWETVIEHVACALRDAALKRQIGEQVE